MNALSLRNLLTLRWRAAQPALQAMASRLRPTGGGLPPKRKAQPPLRTAPATAPRLHPAPTMHRCWAARPPVRRGVYRTQTLDDAPPQNVPATTANRQGGGTPWTRLLTQADPGTPLPAGPAVRTANAGNPGLKIGGNAASAGRGAATGVFSEEPGIAAQQLYIATATRHNSSMATAAQPVPVTQNVQVALVRPRIRRAAITLSRPGSAPQRRRRQLLVSQTVGKTRSGGHGAIAA